jgi:hypothetical protein
MIHQYLGGLILRAKLMVVAVALILILPFNVNSTNLTSNSTKKNQINDQTNHDFANKNIENLLSNTPIAFTENRGQVKNNEVRFYDQGGSIWFTDDGVWFELREYAETRGRGSQLGRQGGVSGLDFDPMRRFEPPESLKYKRVVLKLEFVGANQVQPIGRERLTWNSNFFYGNDSEKWCTDVPNYAEIYYENLYNGIDLRYYPNENGLKYDLIVYPGSDVNQVKIRYNGADGLEIDKFGNLVVKTEIENIIDSDLYIYQEFFGTQHQIDGKFRIIDDQNYSFAVVDEYNHQEPLVIDPDIQLRYSTFIGGSSFESAFDVEVDQNLNAYITGYSGSLDFPNTTGAYDDIQNGGLLDLFVSKLNPQGASLLYSTYIGGLNWDSGRGIEIDSSGNAYILGRTNSSDFSTTQGAFDTSYNDQSNDYDVFVLKLNQTGSKLLYSTFVGGSLYDNGADICIDDNGNAYVAGGTQSSNFPTTPGAYSTTHMGFDEPFVFKLNSNGSKLIYSTFIGGRNGDQAHCIAIDNDGNAYVSGETRSNDFPNSTNAFDRSFNGAIDVFVLKLSQGGSALIYSTYVGGNANDWAFDIAVSSNDTAFVTGYTASTNFPVTPGAYDTTFNGGEVVGDVFVINLNVNGSALIFSTYIGGNNWDLGNGIKLNSFNEIYLTGWTNSTNFPATADAYCNSSNGSRDIFVCILTANGSSLLYSTYLGGNSYEHGYGICLDSKNDIYVTGDSSSINFPTTTGAFNRTLNGPRDAILSKLSSWRFMNITSVQLIENQFETSVAYSRYCPYTFRVKIFDNMNPLDVKSVQLQLDSTGISILLTWDSQTGQFTKQFDDLNFINLEQSSSANILFPWWTIDFNVTFNWNYPDEDYRDVCILATSYTLPVEQLISNELYRVENDLVFYMPVRLKDEDGRIINEMDLARGGGILNWSGPKPIYEDSIFYHPPDSEYNVTVWNEEGKCWIDRYSSAEKFNVQTVAAKATNLVGDKHIINLTGIPPECDKTNTSFTLRIDGENVTFSDPTPKESTWQNKTMVTVGINITDHGGGKVKGSSVMYNISKDNGTTWKNWTEIPYLKSAESINPEDIVFLNEGTNNLIKWQAEDSVKNGPTFSPIYRILVDTQEVSFSNATPEENYEYPTTKVEVGITIFDITSGVNATSIEYAVSTDYGNTWGDWVPVVGFVNENIVNIKLNLSFPNGSANRIKWRAYDVAGNGPSESKAYVVKVNTWLQTLIPKVRLWSPPNGSTIPTNSVKLQWILENTNLIGVTYDLYFDTMPPTKPNITDLAELSYNFDDLIDGETYYWTVIPRIGSKEGICKSNIWSFKIDTSVAFPTVKLLRPENGSIVSSTKPTLMWSFEYYGTETLSYYVYLESRSDLKTFDESFNPYYLPSSLLEDNQTYYWKVVPKAGSILGPESETWSFTVRKGYIPHFELDLKVEPPGIVMEPGSIKIVKAFVTNKGELTDRISLSIKVPSDSDMGGMVNEPNIQEAEPGETANFSFILTTTQNIDAGEVIITVTATSGEALDFGIDFKEELKVKVIIFVEEEANPENFSEWLYFWGILIIIIVIILASLILILVRRKKQAQEAVPENKTDTLKPLETPTIEQTQEVITGDEKENKEYVETSTPKPALEKPQAVEPEAQIPAKSTVDTSQQLTQSTTPKPTLAVSPSVGQVLVAQQIPEVEQKPELSPAESEKTNEGEG